MDLRSWSISELFIGNLILNDLEKKSLPSALAIVSTLFNDFTYCHLSKIVLFNINRLFADSKVVTVITV